jgi:hypothetical protein
MAYQDLKATVESTKSETQVRDEIYRADAIRWYPGTHALNAFSIMSPRDGHEVARCDRRKDRDHLLMLARSHDALAEALTRMLGDQEKGAESQLWDREFARAALKLAGR